MMSMQRHVVLSIGVFLAVVTGGIGTLALPTWREMGAVRAQEASLHHWLNNLEVMTAQVEHLGSELDAARHRTKYEFKTIPESADVAEIMRRLSVHVDGISVLDQTFTAGSAAEALPGAGHELPTQILPVTVEMQADFNSVFEVIRTAERLDRLVRITFVRIACNRDKPGSAVSAPATNQAPMLTASIGLEAVYEPAQPRQPATAVAGNTAREVK